MLLRLLRTRYLTTNNDEPLTAPLTRDFVEDLTPIDALFASLTFNGQRLTFNNQPLIYN